MAAVTGFLTGQTQTRKLSNDVLTKTVVLDFSVNNSATSDTVLVSTPAKGDLVLHIATKVLTAGTSGSSFKVGDCLTASPYTAGDDNGWIDNSVTADALTTGLSRPADAYPVLGGKLYDGTQSIALLMSAHAQTALKVEVTIVFAIMKNYSES
jgi:hypothetical protein